MHGHNLILIWFFYLKSEKKKNTFTNSEESLKAFVKQDLVSLLVLYIDSCEKSPANLRYICIFIENLDIDNMPHYVMDTSVEIDLSKFFI